MAGAAALAAVLVLVVARPGVAATTATGREALARLQRVHAEVEQELEGLQALALLPGLDSAERAVALQAHLGYVELRLWWLETQAGAILEAVAAGIPGRAAPPAAGARAQATVALEAAGITGADGVKALLGAWDACAESLAQARSLEAGLWAAARGTAADLPTPGRACPVDGPHHFVPTWGERRPWGREHKGEDVHAARGTPLVAIESGAILQAGWHWQGGYGVYLRGHYSGDVYYYAHLARPAPGIRPGAVVEVGDLLGWVGSSGNATSPHLHLGWIPDNPGPWADLDLLADPYPLLVSLCRPGLDAESGAQGGGQAGGVDAPQRGQGDATLP